MKAYLGCAVLLLLIGVLALSATAQQPTKTPPATLPPPRPAPAAPKLEAIAETKLLMEALAQPNYGSLEKHLAQRPADADKLETSHGGQAACSWRRPAIC